jgi:hypothetical protein
MFLSMNYQLIGFLHEVSLAAYKYPPGGEFTCLTSQRTDPSWVLSAPSLKQLIIGEKLSSRGIKIGYPTVQLYRRARSTEKASVINPEFSGRSLGSSSLHVKE